MFPVSLWMRYAPNRELARAVSVTSHVHSASAPPHATYGSAPVSGPQRFGRWHRSWPLSFSVSSLRLLGM